MSREKYENYFNAKVRKILEDMTLAILKNQPDKPVHSFFYLALLYARLGSNSHIKGRNLAHWNLK